MTGTPRILALAGSLRAGSYNRRMVTIAAEGARGEGAEVTHLDLREYRLPVFDEDLESAEGPPEAVVELKSLFRSHQGLLIASPEYNGSLSAALKNLIDWVSRPDADKSLSSCFAGKVAGIMAASPGGLGGLRGLGHLRTILSGIQVLVIPQQTTVSAAYSAFDDDDSLKDEKKAEAVRAIGHAVAEVTRKLNA